MLASVFLSQKKSSKLNFKTSKWIQEAGRASLPDGSNKPRRNKAVISAGVSEIPESGEKRFSTARRVGGEKKTPIEFTAPTVSDEENFSSQPSGHFLYSLLSSSTLSLFFYPVFLSMFAFFSQRALVFENFSSFFFFGRRNFEQSLFFSESSRWPRFVRRSCCRRRCFSEGNFVSFLLFFCQKITVLR